MFTFAHFMWYDPQEKHGCVRVTKRFCNVTMLGQILPKTLRKNPVSESGNVVTAFRMFRGDAGICRANFWPASSFWCRSLSFASRRLCVRPCSGSWNLVRRRDKATKVITISKIAVCDVGNTQQPPAKAYPILHPLLKTSAGFNN